MKRYQIENIVPFIFSIISVYLIIKNFRLNYFILIDVIIVVGLIIWWCGKISLGDAFTSFPKANKLISKGIYSKIRHPIYVGLSITLIGWSLLITNLFVWIIIFLVILSLIIRAYFEEKILLNKFGKQYIKYKKSTWF